MYALSVALLLAFLLGCAAATVPSPQTEAAVGLTVRQTPILRAHPWIEAEIREFLGQAEVRAVLGFDPLAYEMPFTVSLLEQRLSERGIFRMFGTSANQDVYIHGRLYTDGTVAHEDGHFGADGDPLAARKQRMLQILAVDPDLLTLYRNLLICHEVAHVGEWYALERRGAVVTYTGHGISDRVEVRILTRMLHAGKVRPEVYAKLFLFYATFMNQDAEPFEAVARYYHQAMAPIGELSSTFPDDRLLE